MQYKVSADVFSKTVGEEEVLLDPVSGNYFGMNDVGTLIWAEMKMGTSAPAIIVRIEEEFEVDASAARADLADFVSRLENLGLIKNDGL